MFRFFALVIRSFSISFHTVIPLIMLASITITCSCRPSRHGKEIRAAADRGDVGKVPEVLEHNPTLVDSKGEQNWTPLFFGVANDHMDVAEFLLAAGADLNAKASDGYTPLHEAAFHGYTDVRNGCCGRKLM